MAKTQTEDTKPKGVKSHLLPKRPVTIDKKTGKPIDREHHSVIAGSTDRGHPDAPFYVSGVSKHNGTPMITNHHTYRAAANAGLHLFADDPPIMERSNEQIDAIRAAIEALKKKAKTTETTVEEANEAAELGEAVEVG